MQALKEHSIPFTGLKDGQHKFDFVLGHEFFDAANEEDLTGGQLHALVTLDKTPTLLVAGIHVEGTVATTCDHCNSALDLPVTGDQQQIFQLHGEADPDDDELVVLAPQEHSINLSHYIYECLRLALPARRVHPPGQCDPEVEAVLGHLAVDQADDEHDHAPDPRWDALKQLKNK